MVLFTGVLLVDPRGWILLQERDEHAPIDPECWGLAGGHLEPGEEFEECAYRELVEETGVALPRGTLRVWREFSVWHDAYGSQDRIVVFVAPTTLTDADIVVGEGRQIVFVEPAAARGLPLSTAATEVVPAFLESDVYRRMAP